MSLNNILELEFGSRRRQVHPEEPSRSFATIAALPSNAHAIEAALMFSTGLKGFLAITGPSGWGKSHILDAVACRVGYDTGVAPSVDSAIEWIQRGARADSSGPLLLDDVQDAMDGPRMRLVLQIALERRVKGGKPTLLSFNSSKTTRQIKAVLPNPRGWTIGALTAPDAFERGLVIEKMASAEGMDLSPALVHLMAARMKGDGRTLVGALKRLKLSRTDWTSGRQVLAACGTLEPFFADCSGWDLARRIIRTSEHDDFAQAEVSPANLALHTMLQIAGLSEASVARCFGVQPGEAYSIASGIESIYGQCESVRNLRRRFILRVVEDLVLE